MILSTAIMYNICMYQTCVPDEKDGARHDTFRKIKFLFQTGIIEYGMKNIAAFQRVY